MAPLGDENRCEAKPRHYRFSILLPHAVYSPDHGILFSRLSTAVSIAKAIDSSSLQRHCPEVDLEGEKEDEKTAAETFRVPLTPPLTLRLTSQTAAKPC